MKSQIHRSFQVFPAITKCAVSCDGLQPSSLWCSCTAVWYYRLVIQHSCMACTAAVLVEPYSSTCRSSNTILVWYSTSKHNLHKSSSKSLLVDMTYIGPTVLGTGYASVTPMELYSRVNKAKEGWRRRYQETTGLDQTNTRFYRLYCCSTEKLTCVRCITSQIIIKDGHSARETLSPIS